MKRAVIMVGLPGSGKSTRTSELVDELEDGLTHAIHSTDSYHMIDGEYVFQPKALGYYHRLNQEAYKKSVDEGVDLVICDNTNIKAKDRKWYAQYARRQGYDVSFEVVGEFTEEFAKVCAERNVHGVPLESILRMASRIQLPENKDQ